MKGRLDPENALEAELDELLENLRQFSAFEGVFRLRALIEISQKLDTEALVTLAARCTNVPTGRRSSSCCAQTRSAISPMAQVKGLAAEIGRPPPARASSTPPLAI
jgi:hypothetical protein